MENVTAKKETMLERFPVKTHLITDVKGNVIKVVKTRQCNIDGVLYRDSDIEYMERMDEMIERYNKLEETDTLNDEINKLIGEEVSA